MAAYRIHRLDTGMAVKQAALEEALHRLEGEVVAIVPNIMQFPFARVNYLLIVEQIPSPEAGAFDTGQRVDEPARWP